MKLPICDALADIINFLCTQARYRAASAWNCEIELTERDTVFDVVVEDVKMGLVASCCSGDNVEVVLISVG